MNDMALDYKRRDISVDDYHRMAEAGIFGPEERVELIDGELIEMPPIGLRHWSRHAAITGYLVMTLGTRALVVPQGSFPLGRRNEPQPDFALLAPLDYAARNAPPAPSEIFGFVEVSDSSVAFDRGRKLRMYATQGVREYLVVDLARNRLTFYTQPSEVGYAETRELHYGETFRFAALADITLEADSFLDPPAG